MSKKKFTNRKVDKVPLKKSKDYMWRYIKSKTSEADVPEGSSAWDKLKDWLMVPARLVSAGAVASLVIVALVFTTNFSGWFDGAEIKTINRPSTVHASFEMTASDIDDAGVSSDSVFVLASSEDLDTEVVKEHLKVYPEVEVEVVKSDDGIYEVKPVGDLDANKVYNFTIQTAEREFSWAYQVQDDFKVTGSLPGNQETIVPLDTGIEIYFSHEDFDFDQAKKNFSISPSVKGSFEQYRRAFVFVPANELAEGQIYNVTMEAGVEFADGEMELEEDYSFAFETDGDYDDSGERISFRDSYYEMSPGGALGLRAYTWDFDQSGDESFEMLIWQYDGVDDYIEELTKASELPVWCFYSKKNANFDTKGLDYLGSFESFADKSGYQSYVYTPGAELDAGYYLIQAEENGPQVLLQVTEVSAYANITATDSLVWANDVNTGEPIEGATVEISGIDSSFETGTDGVATFTTPESWKVDYKDREQAYVHITTDDGRSLITRLIPYWYQNSGDNYWLHLDTDRPVYKPEDTVRFWGFAEGKSSDYSTDDLTMRLEYGWEEYVDEKEVRVNEDGSFEGRFVLNNFDAGYYSLELWAGDVEITTQSIRIESYTKPAYNLSVSADRNAAFVGEEIEYDITTEFFDGTPAVNIGLGYYSGGSNDESLYTDEHGETSVSLEADSSECYEYSNYCYIQRDKYFEVSTLGSEVADLSASTEVMIFNSKVYLDVDKTNEDGNATLDFTTNWVSLDAINSSDNDTAYQESFIGEAAKNRTIEGTVTEYYWEKVEDGTYYDFINKKSKTQYRYDKHESVIDTFQVETGKSNTASYNFSYDEGKYYRVRVSTKDDEGHISQQVATVYGNSSRSSDYDYFKVEVLNGEESEDAVYGYNWWSNSGKSFDIGDTVETALYNNDAPLSAEEDDSFLFMQLTNGLQNFKVQNETEFDFEFGKNEVPNTYVGAVRFDGEKYETFNMTGVNYNEDLKALDVEVQSDKEEYAPGEEVEISVKVSDLDGTGVETSVNLNMIDEAYYRIFNDNFEDPLDAIYSSVGDGVLVSYDSHDNVLESAELDGGKGGCFTEDTQILMADGSYKRIADIRPGDRVLTKKHEYSSQLVEAEVVNHVSHFVSEYLVVNDELEITGVHTVFVNGAWDVAANLKIGDKMLSKNGDNIVVSSIEKVVAPVWVYNFEVEGLHTYFANDYYVHNDKGGSSGSVRSKFKDNALFELVQTDANGEATVKFTLPDNVTTWRVSAAAIDTKNLQAGTATEKVKVTLPFFTDLVLNSEYSVKDTPFLQMRSYGVEVEEGDEVNYVVGAESLGIDASEVIEGEVYENSLFDLGELTLGEHEITVFSESGSYDDALMKETEVVGSRLNQTFNDFIREVGSETKFEMAEEGMTEIKLIDGGVGYYYWDLVSMTYQYGDRLDQRLAELMSNEMLNEYFGDDRESDFEDIVANYQNGGLQLLPYGDPDLRLTANVLLVDGVAEKFNNYALKNYLYEVYQDKDSNLEDVVYALVGLAAIDEPVLLSLRAIVEAEELSLQEKMYIGLAFNAIGAKGEAKELFEEEFDNLLELEEGHNESVVTNALAASLAAGVGDIENAEVLWEFVDLFGMNVEDYSINEDLINIYKLSYIANSLPNVASNPVKLRMTKNGHTETVELDAWDCFGVVGTANDDISVEVIRGTLAASVSYEKAVNPVVFDINEDLSIERSYWVQGEETNTFSEGDLVMVRLKVDYTGALDNPFFRVTDILPSGLTPVSSWQRNNEYNYDYSDTNHPYRIDGQEMSFYWNTLYYDRVINYYARVISPGEYYADPAKIEHYYEESVASISESDMVMIEGGIRVIEKKEAPDLEEIEFDEEAVLELFEELDLEYMNDAMMSDEAEEIILIPVE
jgi:hypothetical protein